MLAVVFKLSRQITFYEKFFSVDALKNLPNHPKPTPSDYFVLPRIHETDPI